MALDMVISYGQNGLEQAFSVPAGDGHRLAGILIGGNGWVSEGACSWSNPFCHLCHTRITMLFGMAYKPTDSSGETLIQEGRTAAVTINSPRLPTQDAA